MSAVVNLTPWPTALSVGRDANGRSQLTVSVKASFAWSAAGEPVAIDPVPLLAEDLFVGEPAVSGIAKPADVGSLKPRLDVLVIGALAFPAPITETEVVLEVGRRLQKAMRVFGDRYWLPTVLVNAVAPSRPKAVERVALFWERSFGGTDPTDASFYEPRNPVGSGVAKKPQRLEGRPAPSFEDPKRPIKSSKERLLPHGLGPIAPHWQPRIKLAGSYDEAWEKRRCPLPPTDFNPAFFNVAPEDQQLDGYLVGEEVRLHGMTVRARERFALPPLRVPIFFRSRSQIFETFTRVDTVVIEPAERRFSLVARAAYTPSPTVLAMRQIVVGTPSLGRRRALESGKLYLDLRAAARG